MREERLGGVDAATVDGRRRCQWNYCRKGVVPGLELALPQQGCADGQARQEQRMNVCDVGGPYPRWKGGGGRYGGGVRILKKGMSML